MLTSDFDRCPEFSQNTSPLLEKKKTGKGRWLDLSRNTQKNGYFTKYGKYWFWFFDDTYTFRKYSRDVTRLSTNS